MQHAVRWGGAVMAPQTKQCNGLTPRGTHRPAHQLHCKVRLLGAVSQERVAVLALKQVEQVRVYMGSLMARQHRGNRLRAASAGGWVRCRQCSRQRGASGAAGIPHPPSPRQPTSRSTRRAAIYRAWQYLRDVAVPQQLHAKAVLVVPAGQVRQGRCGGAGPAGGMSDAVAIWRWDAVRVQANKQPYSWKCNSRA